jgi:hypothetical protein
MKNTFTDRVEALIEDLELAVKAAPRSKEFFCRAVIEKITELAQRYFWDRSRDKEIGSLEITAYAKSAMKKVFKLKKEE